MTLDERTITLYAGGIAEIGDGCQFLLFDLPKLQGDKRVGMYVPHTDPTIYQGDRIEIALTPRGTLLDHASWKCYRVNEGIWITCTGMLHHHDLDAERAAVYRAYNALQAYQSKPTSK